MNRNYMKMSIRLELRYTDPRNPEESLTNNEQMKRELEASLSEILKKHSDNSPLYDIHISLETTSQKNQASSDREPSEIDDEDFPWHLI